MLINSNLVITIEMIHLFFLSSVCRLMPQREVELQDLLITHARYFFYYQIHFFLYCLCI